MKYAVIGLGIGGVHAHAVAAMEGVELVGVCDLAQERAERVAGETGTRAFTDWQQMVEEVRPEAVSVCTNPKTHLPIGAGLAKQGIHVLCEKPMAPDYAQAQQLAEACEQAGVVLAVAQKKRFAPATAFVKEHVGGDFGRPISVNYRFHLGQVPMDWFWAEDDGGGPLVENSVHVFDTLRYVIGEIKTIRGLGGNLFVKDRAPQIDIALGLLEFENGCIGAVELGAASEWCVADEEFFVGCENGVLRWRGRFDCPQEVQYVLRDKQEPQSFSVDYDGAAGSRDFAREIGQFVGCITKGDAPVCPGRDAARSVACCQAMKQAVREGTTVTVPV